MRDKIIQPENKKHDKSSQMLQKYNIQACKIISKKTGKDPQKIKHLIETYGKKGKIITIKNKKLSCIDKKLFEKYPEVFFKRLGQKPPNVKEKSPFSAYNKEIYEKCLKLKSDDNFQALKEAYKQVEQKHYILRITAHNGKIIQALTVKDKEKFKQVKQHNEKQLHTADAHKKNSSEFDELMSKYKDKPQQQILEKYIKTGNGNIAQGMNLSLQQSKKKLIQTLLKKQAIAYNSITGKIQKIPIDRLFSQSEKVFNSLKHFYAPYKDSGGNSGRILAIRVKFPKQMKSKYIKKIIEKYDEEFGTECMNKDNINSDNQPKIFQWKRPVDVRDNDVSAQFPNYYSIVEDVNEDFRACKPEKIMLNQYGKQECDKNKCSKVSPENAIFITISKGKGEDE